MDIPTSSQQQRIIEGKDNITYTPTGQSVYFSVSFADDSPVFRSIPEDTSETRQLLDSQQIQIDEPSYGSSYASYVISEKENLIFNPTRSYGGTTADENMVICCHGNQYRVCPAEHLEDSVPADKLATDEHCHPQRESGPDKTARKKLITASILCLVFMLGEIIGGVLSNSLAIATDAAHLLTDFASFMISLFALYIATLPATKKMSFGYYRAEVVGALVSVLMIWVVTGVLVVMAAERVQSGNYDIDSEIMLITSGVGVLVNIIMGLVLHQHGHSHGGATANHAHTDAHSHGANLNVRAAFIHVVGDLLQSIGVFVAALFIYFKPAWKIADPICTFVFSVLVMITTFAIIRDALRVLMEGIPRGIDYNDVQDIFQQINGVIKVHNLRIWALSMDKTAVSCHLAIKSGHAQQDILNAAIQKVRAKYDIFDMTLQIEYYSEEMGTCDQCQTPKD